MKAVNGDSYRQVQEREFGEKEARKNWVLFGQSLPIEAEN